MKKYLLSIFIFLVGCTQTVFLSERYNVIYQICLPEKSFDLRDGIVVKVIDDDTHYDGGELPWGITNLGQPVYMRYGSAPNESKYITVKLLNNDNQFVFNAPIDVKEKYKWSEWKSSNFTTTNIRFSWAAVHNKEIEKEFKVDKYSPKIRYSIMKFQEYLNMPGPKYGEGMEGIVKNVPNC